MPGQNFAAQFEGVVFEVRVTQTLALELELAFLSPRGAVLRVVSPGRFKGERVRLPSIPSFGLPELRGYYRAGRLSPRFTEHLIDSAQLWYRKRHALELRRDAIGEYLDLGFSKAEVAAWVESEIGAHYAVGQFEEMLGGLEAGA